MQGGTLQEQFCQTQNPQGVQRRSSIHPVTDKPEPQTRKLRPLLLFLFLATIKQIFLASLHPF